MYGTESAVAKDYEVIVTNWVRINFEIRGTKSWQKKITTLFAFFHPDD